MKEYKPNEQIVDRAVELWKRMLRNPKYDNIGDGPASSRERASSMFCSVMATMIPSNATEERLSEFGRHLKAALITPRPNSTPEFTFYENSLHVDYGPDATLSEAADACGLKMEWPWKTGMWLSEDYVSVRYGYGAEEVCHYPMTSGRWLVVRLRGSDINKVVALAEQGIGGFEIESPE